MKYLIVIICLLMSGCGYNKTTFVKVKGDEVNVPIKGVGVISGKGIEAKINRTVSLISPANEVTIKSEVDNRKDTIKTSDGGK